MSIADTLSLQKLSTAVQTVKNELQGRDPFDLTSFESAALTITQYVIDNAKTPSEQMKDTGQTLLFTKDHPSYIEPT